MKLILASASPRRREILSALGVAFEVRPSRTDEGSAAQVAAADAPVTAVSLARAKAAATASEISAGDRALVIGADTLVVLPGRVLGKPGTAAEAEEMLRALSGRPHSVITGVAVIDTGTGRTTEGVEETRVFFRELGEDVVRAYAASGEPADKAGAYAVQGLGALLVRRIEGCYFNVVGLPVGLLAELIARLGGNLWTEAVRGHTYHNGGGTCHDVSGPAQ